MGEGPLGPLKLHLAAKVQFWLFTTGPDLSNRGLFFKASLPSPNVEKCDHEESAWARVPMPPKTTLGCKSSILSIHDRSVPVEPRPFFKAALPSPECREM